MLCWTRLSYREIVVYNQPGLRTPALSLLTLIPDALRHILCRMQLEYANESHEKDYTLMLLQN
jgi:hypothetical protein